MADRQRRKSDAARRANQVVRSRTLLMMLLFGITTFVLLFIKLYDLQIIKHEDLQEKAVAQQTRSTVVTASRGTIYDRNGNTLAISATAETVFVSPAEIAENQEDTKEIAQGLSRILGVDADTILKKMQKTSSQYEVVKLRADQQLADQVRQFINGEVDAQGNAVAKENQKKLSGIYLSTDSKRYYPYSTLASQVIGFVGTDNTGLYGLEAKYDSVLEGTSGLTVTAKNAAGTDLLYQYEQYYDPKNGDNLVLTLDTNIQYYLEKGIEEMVDKFDAKNGATGIVMDVNSGAILAMASYPTYDLNSPSSIYDKTLEASLKGLDTNSTAYTSALGAAQLKQWRNKCINDTYEPGSTFKPITLSTALEVGAINMNTKFYCSGSIRVPGWSKPIYCSKKSGHGSETLVQATGNSCNPAFITMGLKVGTQDYYKYLQSFGLMELTGIDENGETSGIFANEKSFNSNVVSLASYAFGQTFTITPLQLIRAQASCINGGYLYTPYLVSQVLDDKGNVVSQHDSTPVRQVISKETSEDVRQCLEYVVAQGTGKNGQVAGYRIGGKTGTADKTGDPNHNVVVSFMCFAPADDPQIIMLVTMDSPSRSTGTYVSGGQMVAPTASSIMSEILPYLGIEPDYSAQELVGADATVPNCVGCTLESAKTKLTNYGFGYKVKGDGATVTDQTPVGGSIVPNNADIILYMGEKKPDALCTVPHVTGMSASAANQAITNAGLIMKVAGATSSSSGNVYAISQDTEAGAKVAAGTVVTVRFGDNSVLD